MSRILAGSVALAASMLAALISTNADAQKAKDTLRFPLLEVESTLDGYLTSGWFHQVWSRSVYDSLIGFDPANGKFTPELASSWSQPTPTTYEFELRSDTKWHDGQSLTADDVVYTISWLIDPKTQFRYKADWAWIQSVEKLGPNKVKITSKLPVPGGLMTLAGSTTIYPQHVHKPLENKQEFGARPVGTGLYRILKLDKNSGVSAERNPDYKPSVNKPAATIARVIAEPIQDPGTLVAALLTGKADIAANLSGDQAEDLKKSGKFDVTLSPPAVGYTFLGFPAGGRTNVKALADPRVRKAIVMAIDRKALVKVTYGGLAEGVQPVEALCLKEQLGCGYTKPVPDYDPAGAKKLLTEAGYGDGFDVTIATFPRYLQPATAVSGMLRAIGIRATVQPHPIANRVQMLRDNRIDMSYYSWSGGNQFEVSGNIGRHFLAKDYADEPLQQAAEKTLAIMDDKERRAAVAKVFDEVTEKAYAFAMLPNRFIYTHTKEVALVNPNDVREMDIIGVHEWRWK